MIFTENKLFKLLCLLALTILLHFRALSGEEISLKISLLWKYEDIASFFKGMSKILVPSAQGSHILNCFFLCFQSNNPFRLFCSFIYLFRANLQAHKRDSVWVSVWFGIWWGKHTLAFLFLFISFFYALFISLQAQTSMKHPQLNQWQQIPRAFLVLEECH